MIWTNVVLTSIKQNETVEIYVIGDRVYKIEEEDNSKYFET